MQRAFSSFEAWVYEALIAAAVTDSVAPSIEAAITGTRVLDVGCGGGSLAARLRRGGREVVGIDPSAFQAKRTRGVRAAAGALPFADKSFDSVVSSCSIKHWPDATAGLAECRRVLRPGGALIVIEMDRSSTREEMARFARMTRIPRLLRPAYVRFDLRSVLPTAPTANELGAMVGAEARKIEGLPYNVVIAVR